jgi:thiamine transport system substrate-binding protein
VSKRSNAVPVKYRFPMLRSRTTTSGLALALFVALATITGCGGGSRDGNEPAHPATDQPAASTVTLVTHDSFAMDPDVLKDFETSSGYSLTVLTVGDAGTLTNQLVLTKDAPLGDAFFGVDNTLSSRLTDNNVTTDLVPVTRGDVCLNYDAAWFADKGITPPTSLTDLTTETYQDLLVTINPATSSPGLAFLLTTIDTFGTDGFNGKGWTDYWQALMANGAIISSDWSDAYFAEFSGAGEGGTRPIVVSYSSSPAFTVDANGDSTTGALLDACFRQTEYAGVLAGASNPDGAAALMEFLVSDEFQRLIPEQMYVYPASDATELPPDWARLAPLAEHPVIMDPAEIAANRQAWLDAWATATAS